MTDVIKKTKAIGISPARSVVLDFTRFSLAIIVTIAHLSQRYFQVGWPVLTDFGVFAVGGFFVLSGFTIRGMSSSHDRDFNGRKFLTDRLSRLLSISLLAVVLTILLDAVSYQFGRDFYLKYWGHHLSDPLVRVFLNVILVNQSYGSDWSLFSNGPFWSLGYELGFYCIWAAWLSIRGTVRGWLLFIATLAFFGPNILALMPIWLMGVVLYSTLNQPRWFRFVAGLACISLLILIARCLGFGGVMHEAMVFNEHLKAAFAAMGVGIGNVSANICVGAGAFFLVMCPLLVAVSQLEDRIPVPPMLVAFGRKLGELTFPLYLIHFPLFVLLRSLNAYDPASTPQKFVVLILACLAAAWMVPVGDKLKVMLRSASQWPRNPSSP